MLHENFKISKEFLDFREMTKIELSLQLLLSWLR